MTKTEKNARERIIETTTQLFRRQGYHATGLNQIVEASQAPKGSLYHYFPGGKEELAVEAVRLGKAKLVAGLATARGTAKSTGETMSRMAEFLAESLKASSFQDACPISTVALETSTEFPVLQQACSETFKSLEAMIEHNLKEDGYSAVEARDLANLMMSAYLGGLLLSRTHLDAAHLVRAIETLRKILPPPRPARKKA